MAIGDHIDEFMFTLLFYAWSSLVSTSKVIKKSFVSSYLLFHERSY